MENKKDKSSCQRCFVRRGLIALGLSLAAITLIVVVIVVWFRPSSASDKSAENNDDAQCSFSKEARRVGLDLFLEKLRTEYHRYHPNRIASKPGVTSSEVRQVYQPYDFRPEAIKNATDASTRLYNELQTTVFADVHEQKLKLRERKAMYVAKNVLSVVFGWNPYEENYYSGDWMLGPNIFCWQPACNVLNRLQESIPHFKPVKISDIQVLRGLLQEHNSSIRQYNENLRSAVKVGMVRPLEACKVGVREFKKRFLPIAVSNETGKYEICFLYYIL